MGSKPTTGPMDVSHIRFESAVFPTAADLALWESLSEAERLAWLRKREEAAYRSGVADKASKDEIMAEVLAELKDGR